MKITCSLTIIVLFAVVNDVKSMDTEQYEKFVLEKAGDCKKETNASDEDFKEMISGLLPTTRNGKCLNACVMNKLGAMNEEKFVPDLFAKMICEDVLQLKGSNGKAMREIMKDMAEDCRTVSHPDKCESAYKISSCILTAAKKRGFDKTIP